MESRHWQLKSPLDAIIFDCDGTLSTIEGIDFLAEQNHLGDHVKQLTAEAMGKTGINPELYQQRLDLVKPTRQQVQQLGHHYFAHKVLDSDTVIQVLTKLNKAIYIVSAGLKPAVLDFAKKLGVNENRVFAVNAEFDRNNHYCNFDHHSPLVHNDGKRVIVEQIKKQHTQLAYIGDGLNDLIVRSHVTRFIGYGGAYFRENIAAACEFYITSARLAPLLPLCLTESEKSQLTHDDLHLYQKGLQALENREVLIKNE